ncbi:unnamed protein product [Lepidochelys kempii]
MLLKAPSKEQGYVRVSTEGHTPLISCSVAGADWWCSRDWEQSPSLPQELRRLSWLFLPSHAVGGETLLAGCVAVPAVGSLWIDGLPGQPDGPSGPGAVPLQPMDGTGGQPC